MDPIDVNKLFPSKSYVVVKYIAMACFFIYLFIMVCLCVFLMIRRRSDRSHGRRPQNEDMVRQVPPSREINREDIEMSVLATIPWIDQLIS